MAKVLGVNKVLHTTMVPHTKRGQNETQSYDDTEHLMAPGTIPWYKKAATTAALYFAVPTAAILAIPSETEAANNPEREKAVVSLATESWQPLKAALDRQDQSKELKDVVPNSNSLWNNIQAVMHVTDDTMVREMDSLRLEILKRGVNDPNVPPRIVHSALYTTAVYAQGINKAIAQNEAQVAATKKEQEELQKKITDLTNLKVALPEDLKTKQKEMEQKITALQSETQGLRQRLNGASAYVLPYMGKVIVDTKTKDDRRERHLAKPEEVDRLRSFYPVSKVYAPRNFNKLAGYVLAQISEDDLSKRMVEELLMAGNDTVRRRAFFDVFFNASPESIPGSVKEKSLEWVFGKDQIASLKKKDKKDDKSPATIIIAPSPSPKGAPSPSEDTTKAERGGVQGTRQTQPPPPPGSIAIQLPPGTVITQPKPPTPGAPMWTTGSLELLTELDKRLTAIYLPYYSTKSAEDQQFIADNISLLTQTKDQLTVTVDGKEEKIESALVASAQWFALKHYSKANGRGFTSADYTVLRSLATMARDNKLAFDILRRTLGSFPELFASSYFSGAFKLSDRPDRLAGVEVIKAFNANKESAREFLTSLADRKAPLIWKEPTEQSYSMWGGYSPDGGSAGGDFIDEMAKSSTAKGPKDIGSTTGSSTTGGSSFDDSTKAINDAREIGRKYALIIMAYLDESHSFVPYLRDIIRNPLSKEADKLKAIAGVALAKDNESIDSLLKLGMDETQGWLTRALALEGVLYIDAPSPIPESIQKRAAGESPFSPNKLRYAYPVRSRITEGSEERPIQEILDQIEKFGPFNSRIRTLYNAWLEEQTRLANSGAPKGREPVTIANSEKLEVLMELRRREFGGCCGGGRVISTKAGDASFKAHLDGMIKYLESCKEKNRHIDLALALPMMDILGKAGNGKASPVLADMATYPELYVRSDPDAEGFFAFFDLLFTAFGSSIVKMVALEDLGGTCILQDPKDRASEVLHTVARRDSSRMYRSATRRALMTLADRYDDYMKGKHDAGPDNLRIMAARRFHAEQALGHMKHHALGLEDINQMRLYGMYDEFRWAKIVDRLGGTKDLLAYALEASNGNERAQVVRSAMHALRANGKKAEDISTLGFDARQQGRLGQLYNSVNREEFWVGDNHKKQTGAGANFALIDGGYVYPVEKLLPGIEKKIIYPEKMIRWSDMTEWLDLHPTMVAGTFHQMAPDPTIRTYSFLASIPEVRFRPYETQDSAIYALEDMAQLQLAGEANVDVVNYSWGYLNLILANESFRTEWIDLLGAFMEVNSRMGTKHTVAAGNENGYFPGIVRWANQGELNSTGLRYDNKGTASKSDSVFMAGAMDGYANMLAEFSSVNDPLRTLEAIKLLSYQGVHVMTPWVENNEWVLDPSNGTSFAAPSNAFLLAWGIGARRAAGLPDLSHTEWQQLLERTATKRLPHREDWEGGRYLDVTAYLQEVIRPPQAPQPAQPPQPAQAQPAKK